MTTLGQPNDKREDDCWGEGKALPPLRAVAGPDQRWSPAKHFALLLFSFQWLTRTWIHKSGRTAGLEKWEWGHGRESEQTKGLVREKETRLALMKSET